MLRAVMAVTVCGLVTTRMAAEESPIGLVDMARVFKNYRTFQVRTADLRAEVDKVAKQAATMQAMAKGLEQGIANAPDPETRASLERDLLKLRGEFESLKAIAKKDMARREAILYREIYVVVQEEVAAVARERGYAMVLRFNSEPVDEQDDPQAILQKLNRLVVFTEPEQDITAEVLRRLNADE